MIRWLTTGLRKMVPWCDYPPKEVCYPMGGMKRVRGVRRNIMIKVRKFVPKFEDFSI
jgi:hypothetical protein